MPMQSLAKKIRINQEQPRLGTTIKARSSVHCTCKWTRDFLQTIPRDLPMRRTKHQKCTKLLTGIVLMAYI